MKVIKIAKSINWILLILSIYDAFFWYIVMTSDIHVLIDYAESRMLNNLMVREMIFFFSLIFIYQIEVSKLKIMNIEANLLKNT